MFCSCLQFVPETSDAGDWLINDGSRAACKMAVTMCMILANILTVSMTIIQPVQI